MREAHVDSIAHLLKEAKGKQQNKPIVFLGAGMSATGEIPLAGEIAEDILSKYGSNPDVKRLAKDDQIYSKLMACLTTSERNQLLNGYIEKAKVNVAYIYLAHLIKQGYVDYVLTVNFDNLILRAMAMYNLFPPQYDLSILNNIPTSSIEKQSVTYLHGTYRGLRMLNTNEEMDMIRDICPKFFNRIMENRTWIVVGYSGEDPILDHIADLTTFTNNLYWVTYKDREPNDKVKSKLLDCPNTNAYLLKGYDADSFFMRLHAELGENIPDILQNPFTSLLGTMESIVEAEPIKARLEVNKRQVKDAIKRYEEGESSTKYVGKKKDIDLLIKEVIKYTTEQNFDENAKRIEEIRKIALTVNNEELNEELSLLYYRWSMLQSLNNLNESALRSCLKAPNIESYGWLGYTFSLVKDIPNSIKNFEIALQKEAWTTKNIHELFLPQEIQSHPDFIALMKKYEDMEKEER